MVYVLNRRPLFEREVVVCGSSDDGQIRRIFSGGPVKERR